jgi:NAD-dependent deacetylase
MNPYTPEAWDFAPESRLVVLTGAGISAESGIRTFRGGSGLWEDHKIEDVATPEGFHRDPAKVISFYDARRAQLGEVSPNAAHLALARLEEALGDRFLLVTQNIDDLHQRAGSRRVLPMHGELKKLRCLFDDDHICQIDGDQNGTLCPHCGAPLRPHIVWFGEMPFFLDQIQKALEDCTHFAYIGTSSQVYPAAGFRNLARRRGARVLCINLEIEPDPSTHLFLEGKAGEQVPRWVEGMIPG